MVYRDREDAAARLAPALERALAGKPAVLLGIPRGGIVVAAHLGRRLRLPVEAVLSKKIGHPLNPEYAIGVVTLGSARLAEDLDLPPGYLEQETRRLRALLSERERRLRGGRPLSLSGATAVVVDDGAATGLTVLAALEEARLAGAGKVLAALPVASEEAARLIEAECDALVCPLRAPDFSALGDFYEDFTQVDDDAAEAALTWARSR